MDENILMTPKEETVMKLIHYFITEKDYKPVIVHGVKDEIWLENFEASYKLIRINEKYIHNNTQYQTDLYITNSIRKNIKKRTYSMKMNVLNILLDYGENVDLIEDKDIDTIKISEIDSSNIKDVYPGLIDSLNSDRTKDIVEFFKMTEEMNKKNREDEKAFARWNRKPSNINVTNIIILINIIVFLAMYIFGKGSEDEMTLLLFGANYGPLIKSGQIYRLITSSFIHIGIIHLLFNMYALHLVGNEIDKFYGSKKYIVIYLISALVGSLTSTVFNGDYISAGASGAIFGLFGALLYFGLEYRSTLDGILRSSLIPVIVFNLIIGFIIPGIDIACHIGGLVGGFLISKTLGVDGKKKKVDSINSIILLVLLIGFLSYMTFIY